MDFLGVGPTEALFIIVIALIVLGPARMVEVARSLGKLMRDFRRATSDLPSLLSLDEELPPGPSSIEGQRRDRRDAQGDAPKEGPGEG